MAEFSSRKKLFTLRTNRGGEYMSQAFNAFLFERGISHQCIVPYTPKQNGVVERKNRTLLEMARCMELKESIFFFLKENILPLVFRKVITTTTYKMFFPNSSL